MTVSSEVAVPSTVVTSTVTGLGAARDRLTVNVMPDSTFSRTGSPPVMEIPTSLSWRLTVAWFRLPWE